MDRELEKRIREVRCLLFDLDGTLLTGDKRITQYSADVINRAREEGYLIGFSTGRSLGALGGFTRPVGLVTDGPSIGCAGGEIGYLSHDRVERLRVVSFPVDVLRDLLCFALENGLNFSLDGIGPRYYSRGLDYIETYRRDRDNALALGMDYPELIPVAGKQELSRCLDGTVVKPMIWYRDRQQLSLMEKWNREHPGFTNMASGFSLVEVLPESVNKALALEELCAMEGIGPEECCVFGDSENDIPILRRAGLSVAMCDGFPATMEVADLVTEYGSDADGAARAAAQLFLG